MLRASPVIRILDCVCWLVCKWLDIQHPALYFTDKIPSPPLPAHTTQRRLDETLACLFPLPHHHHQQEEDEAIPPFVCLPLLEAAADALDDLQLQVYKSIICLYVYVCMYM